MSKKSRQEYSKILKRRKQKIERRLERKQWEDQERPMFNGRKHPLRGSREESGDQLWWHRSNPSDGAEVWTGGGDKYEVKVAEGTYAVP